MEKVTRNVTALREVVETVTQYKSKDGLFYDKEIDCIVHENSLDNEDRYASLTRLALPLPLREAEYDGDWIKVSSEEDFYSVVHHIAGQACDFYLNDSCKHMTWEQMAEICVGEYIYLISSYEYNDNGADVDEIRIHTFSYIKKSYSEFLEKAIFATNSFYH